MTPTDLVDRLAIRDTLVRYCRGVDRGIAALIASAYHEDGVDERLPQASPGEVAADLVGRLDAFDAVPHHDLTNTTIAIDGDEAFCESYFLAWIPDAAAGGYETLRHVAGRYLDRVERRDGDWRISRRAIVIDVARAGPGSRWQGAGSFSRGARRDADPAHNQFPSNSRLAATNSRKEPTAMSLQAALDRMEIHDLLVRFCRGIDRGDRALVDSVYHPDATDDHGTYKGPGIGFADVVVPRMDETGRIGQHNITNVTLDFDGDTARGESYFVTWNPEADAATGKGRLMLVLGRYLDRFEKRDGVWKISDRRVVIDHAEGGEDGSPWPRLPAFLRGGRREADPSHGFIGG